MAEKAKLIEELQNALKTSKKEIESEKQRADSNEACVSEANLEIIRLEQRLIVKCDKNISAEEVVTSKR